MKIPQRFKLIHGAFSPSEAREVLLALVRSKMEFHNMRLVSDNERFGRDLAHSKKRMEQLKRIEASMKRRLEFAAKSDQTLKITGWIEISARSKSSTSRAKKAGQRKTPASLPR